jgi:organic radical activating enzyme
MEEFYTIQGEGYHTGTAAYFIGIAGVTVGCHWCDVKESWKAELHPPTGIELIVSNASKHQRLLLLLGGEPLMWDMTLLTQKLKRIIEKFILKPQVHIRLQELGLGLFVSKENNK